MKKLFFLTLLSLSSFASDLSHRPPSFSTEEGRAVFVDWSEARYEITYDVTSATASVKATIRMEVPEEGRPVFDLVPTPSKVLFDGEEVGTKEVSTPSAETTVRVVSKIVPPGSHEMIVEVPLTELVRFETGAVRSAFWVTDLDDRFYLERYIPVNLEYDRVKMTFDVSFKGLTGKQHLFANGTVTWIGDDKARIEFPEQYTVNSLYFHTTPVGAVDLLETTFTSRDGRTLPVRIYQEKKGMDLPAELERFRVQTLNVLTELEADYGPFPHASVTIYNASLIEMGLGGMEYAGATVTNLGSLGHELFHSYFARGVTPANGNAGWIDEALASWRDRGYRKVTTLTGTSQMAAHPTYTRKTDTDAYGFGAQFMAHIDHLVSAKGGLKSYMNRLLETKLFTPMFTEEFIAGMESHYGETFEPLFRKHVYDVSGTGIAKMKKEKHPIHKKMGPNELARIL